MASTTEQDEQDLLKQARRMATNLRDGYKERTIINIYRSRFFDQKCKVKFSNPALNDEDIVEFGDSDRYMDGSAYNKRWTSRLIISNDMWNVIVENKRIDLETFGRGHWKRFLRKVARSPRFRTCHSDDMDSDRDQFAGFCGMWYLVFGKAPRSVLTIARERGALVNDQVPFFEPVPDQVGQKKKRKNRKRKKAKVKAQVATQVRSEFDDHDWVPAPMSNRQKRKLDNEKPDPVVDPLRRGIEKLWSARDARNVVEKANGEKTVTV